MTKGFQSIRTQALLFSLGVSFLVLVLACIGLIGLNRIARAEEAVRADAIPALKCVYEAGLALKDGQIISARALIEARTPAEVDEIRQYEAQFKETMPLFEMYVKAMIWGSESDAFARSSGGMVKAVWQREGLQGQLLVKPAPSHIRQLASQADLYYSGFSNNRLRAIASYERVLGLEAEGRPLDAQAELERCDGFRMVANDYARRVDEVFDEIREGVDRYVMASLDGITATRRIVVSVSVLLFLGLVAFILCACLLFSTRVIVRPLQRLTQGALAIGRGELEKIEIGVGGEIGQLAESFNRMVGDLRRFMAAERQLTGASQRRAAELEALKMQLERSNAELQQFAYIASHDLQEPLRMVKSYVQLLERRYKDKLDADAGAFIDFAVDGVTRMQQLINDLLAYSRVDTKGKPFAPTDTKALYQEALDNLQAAIQESGAEITVEEGLPTVAGDAGQLRQIFQNLLSNALKFCQPGVPPRIRVSTARQGDAWCVRVKDNGIGIDPQHVGRLFVLFQRLHTRDEYPGTGIGLAICKRIIERHGGKIWIESTPGQGATFVFTLPDGQHTETSHAPQPG